MGTATSSVLPAAVAWMNPVGLVLGHGHNQQPAGIIVGASDRARMDIFAALTFDPDRPSVYKRSAQAAAPRVPVEGTCLLGGSTALHLVNLPCATSPVDTFDCPDATSSTVGLKCVIVVVDAAVDTPQRAAEFVDAALSTPHVISASLSTSTDAAVCIVVETEEASSRAETVAHWAATIDLPTRLMAAVRRVRGTGDTALAPGSVCLPTMHATIGVVKGTCEGAGDVMSFLEHAILPRKR